MQRATRLARALAPAFLAAVGLALAALPAFGDDGASGLTGVVNVNTATVEELQLLPGIGEARAHAIVALRKQRGGFRSVNDLLEVKGIGEAGLDRLRPHVTVTGKTTATLR
ncbi:MAG: helix-hairpin-helix domain-containing protein [Myxococcales bacterium]|nr:helix-hairpin-helix domain-containing protein [Myxococcales bacterium]